MVAKAIYLQKLNSPVLNEITKTTCEKTLSLTEIKFKKNKALQKMITNWNCFVGLQNYLKKKKKKTQKQQRWTGPHPLAPQVARQLRSLHSRPADTALNLTLHILHKGKCGNYLWLMCQLLIQFKVADLQLGLGYSSQKNNFLFHGK